ncbi:MAG TPA: transaldolase family protein [Candidatus Sulfotelmatobacter sp.]|nr:transaldolase family protein [Candidatus Sulfotelmatobacter sp.]
MAPALMRMMSERKNSLGTDLAPRLFEATNMLANRPKTKILVDGGDPEETRKVKALLGFVDGQTTNPTLIAKNPGIRQRITSGQRLSSREENEAYKKIVQALSPMVGDAGVSIEVFADLNTSAEQMLAQGEEMFTWIPNAYIKYPCTHEGLRAAELSVRNNMRVSMTLCFSQEQAAAVYAATKGSREPVYVSPFVGRLDDRGENGIDVSREHQAHVRERRWPRSPASDTSTTCLHLSR